MKTMILSILFGVSARFPQRMATFCQRTTVLRLGWNTENPSRGLFRMPLRLMEKLDDWKYAVWVAFDSEKELLRGKARVEGER